jgi:catechol 2,3-dioxygenase-like lactoylglutathione lyase family enzyme
VRKSQGLTFVAAVLAVTLWLAPSASAMDLVDLDHVGMNVANLQRSADWYHRVFGFVIIHKWNTTWMVGRDNIRLGLFLRPSASSVADTDKLLMIQHVAFLVDGDKFAAALAALTKAAVKFDPPEDTGIAYSVFFNDPDGHQLELTMYHPASPTKAKALGATSRLGP